MNSKLKTFHTGGSELMSEMQGKVQDEIPHTVMETPPGMKVPMDHAEASQTFASEKGVAGPLEKEPLVGSTDESR
jgi:hypothetical protein